MGRFLMVCAVLGVVFGVWSWEVQGWRPPDRWNPWAPLRLDEPPNWLTRYKLDRLEGDAQQCVAVLSTSAFRFKPVADRQGSPGCGFESAVRVERMEMAVSSPFTLTCSAAVSLALWERHTVQPLARQHFGVPVTRLEHLGSYACRNVYGREGGSRSQHATANALDVAGFVLQGGRRIRIASAWDRGSLEGDANLFLHGLRDGACDHFDGVLGPDYNAAHADHFHLDRSGYRICR